MKHFLATVAALCALFNAGLASAAPTAREAAELARRAAITENARSAREDRTYTTSATTTRAPTVVFQGTTYFRFSLLRVDGHPEGFLTVYELLATGGEAAYYDAYGDSLRFCLLDGVNLRPERGVGIQANGRLYGRGRGYSWGVRSQYDSERAYRDQARNQEEVRSEMTENFCRAFERQNKVFESWDGAAR